MAVTVITPDGNIEAIPPSPGTCRQVIINKGLHTGPEDIRVACNGESVDDKPFADFDGKQLTLRVRLTDPNNRFSKKENFAMLRREKTMPTRRGIDNVEKQEEFRRILERNNDLEEKVQAYFEKSSGMIARFFPNDFQMVINEGKLRRARTELDFTENLLKLRVQFELDAVEEKYQTWLRVIKVKYRQQFYTFVTQQVNQLQETIYEREEEFFSLIRRKYMLLESHKDMTVMAEGYRNYIEREQEKYFSWLEFLMEDFRNIVQEKISSYA